jgi:hypothetical protein
MEKSVTRVVATPVQKLLFILIEMKKGNEERKGNAAPLISFDNSEF